MTTWRERLSDEMQVHGETFDDIAYAVWDMPQYPQYPWRERTPTAPTFEAFLDQEFGDRSGSPEDHHFTLWTRDRVYFPAEYAGDMWVASVPRHPCGEVAAHVGRN